MVTTTNNNSNKDTIQYTILLNERGKFVIPSEIETSSIYDVYERKGYVNAPSLIEAFYVVNSPSSYSS